MLAVQMGHEVDGFVNAGRVHGLKQTLTAHGAHQRVQAAGVEIEERQVNGAGEPRVTKCPGDFPVPGGRKKIQRQGVQPQLRMEAMTEKKVQIVGMLLDEAQRQVDKKHQPPL